MRPVLYVITLLLIITVGCDSRAHAASAWRLAQTIRADDWGVAPIAVSPDGTFLASCSHSGNEVIVHDLKTGRLKYRAGLTRKGSPDFPDHLAFSPDGKTLAFADGPLAFSPDSKTLLGAASTWNAATGRPLNFGSQNGRHIVPAPTRDGITVSAAFSPDGKLIATGSDGGLIFWSASTRKRLRLLIASPGSIEPFAHPGNVNGVAFSPNGKMLVSMGGDGSLREWSVATGKLLKIINSPEGVQALAFRPDGLALCLAYRHDIDVLAFPSGRLLAKLTGHDGDVRTLAYLNKGTVLWSVADDQTIKVWNLARRISTATYGHIQEAVVSDDGSTLAYNIGDDRVIVQDVQTGKRRCSFTGFTAQTNDSDLDPTLVKTLALSSDGRLLAGGVVAEWSGLPTDGGVVHSRVMLWDTRRSKLLHLWDKTPRGIFEPAQSLAFSPDNSLLVESCFDEPNTDSEIRCRALPSGKIFHRWVAIPVNPHYDADTPGYDGAALIFDKKRVLLADSRPDKKTPDSALWNVATGRLLGPLPNSAGRSVDCSGNENLVVIWDYDSHTLAAWNTRTRRKLWSAPCLQITDRIAVGSGGKLIAATTGGVSLSQSAAGGVEPTPITLRDVRTGKIIGSLSGQPGGTDLLAVTRQDSQVVVSSGNGDVRVWQRVSSSLNAPKHRR